MRGGLLLLRASGGSLHQGASDGFERLGAVAEAVEFRKRVADALSYDTIGESVGFFRFREPTARRFVDIVARYVDGDRADQPHEEAIRDLLLEGVDGFDVADVTGMPWIEIDFPNDVMRATDVVLPRMTQASR